MSVYYHFYFGTKWIRVHILSVLNGKKLTIYRAYFVTCYFYTFDFDCQFTLRFITATIYNIYILCINGILDYYSSSYNNRL